MTEREMVEIVRSKLTAMGIPSFAEVAFFSRSIDLVLLKEDKVVAVEFKKSDWKKALKQAKDYRLGADDVYICLKPRRDYKYVIDSATSLGIGVLEFDFDSAEGMKVIQLADRSQHIWSVAQASLRNSLVDSSSSRNQNA